MVFIVPFIGQLFIFSCMPVSPFGLFFGEQGLCPTHFDISRSKDRPRIGVQWKYSQKRKNKSVLIFGKKLRQGFHSWGHHALGHRGRTGHDVQGGCEEIFCMFPKLIKYPDWVKVQWSCLFLHICGCSELFGIFFSVWFCSYRPKENLSLVRGDLNCSVNWKLPIKEG